MWNKEFWKDAVERLVRTFAATYLAAGGYMAKQNTSIQELWNTSALAIAGGATAITLLISLAAGRVKDNNDASFR